LAVADDAPVLHREDFSSPAETAWGELPAGWWLEGAAGGARARIHQGRLWVDANQPKSPGATVWLDRVFAGEVEVSFDVQVVASQGGANNMNLFLLFSDPANADLRASAGERAEGRYPAYHSGRLRGTILTFLADEQDRSVARVRLRQVPPFEPVLAEYTGDHAEAGRTYRVRVLRAGGRLAVEIDGRRVLDVADARSEASGRIGFRTWRTEVWWDNLVVRRPAITTP
jgi:hypothetical protein